MQALAIGAAVAGPLIKGVAGLKAGNAAYRASQAEAHDAELTTNADVLRIRDESRRAIGEQLAAQWSNGFEGGSGTALDALRESQINAAFDAMERRRQGEADARSIRAGGKQARTAGRFALAGGLLEGASNAVNMGGDWAQAKQGTSAGAGG